jgi:hypothetical protein
MGISAGLSAPFWDIDWKFFRNIEMLYEHIHFRMDDSAIGRESKRYHIDCDSMRGTKKDSYVNDGMALARLNAWLTGTYRNTGERKKVEVIPWRS